MEVTLGQTCVSKVFSQIYFCDKNTIQNEFFFNLSQSGFKITFTNELTFPEIHARQLPVRNGTQQNNIQVPSTIK